MIFAPPVSLFRAIRDSADGYSRAPTVTALWAPLCALHGRGGYRGARGQEPGRARRLRGGGRGRALARGGDGPRRRLFRGLGYKLMNGQPQPDCRELQDREGFRVLCWAKSVELCSVRCLTLHTPCCKLIFGAGITCWPVPSMGNANVRTCPRSGIELREDRVRSLSPLGRSRGRTNT